MSEHHILKSTCRQIIARATWWGGVLVDQAPRGIGEVGALTCRYVRRMRRMNLTGKGAAPAAADGVAGLAGLSNVSQSNLLSWAGTFGQGLTSLTKGTQLGTARRRCINCCQTPQCAVCSCQSFATAVTLLALSRLDANGKLSQVRSVTTLCRKDARKYRCLSWPAQE